MLASSISVGFHLTGTDRCGGSRPVNQMKVDSSEKTFLIKLLMSSMFKKIINSQYSDLSKSSSTNSCTNLTVYGWWLVTATLSIRFIEDLQMPIS